LRGPALLAVDSWWKLPVVLAALLYLRLHGIDASLCLRCREYKRDFKFAAAVLVRGYEVVDSIGLMYRLYDALREAGVRFFLGCRVDHVEEGANGVVVRTTCGELLARYLVNAGGLTQMK